MQQDPFDDDLDEFFAAVDGPNFTTFDTLPLPIADVFKTPSRTSGQPRQFPGPAGILPTLSSTEIKRLSDINDPMYKQVSKIIDDDLHSSGETLAILPSMEPDPLYVLKKPWKAMMENLNLDTKSGLLLSMNIHWIVSCAVKSSSIRKIPFLVGIVKDVSGKSFRIVDHTGSIAASVDTEVAAVLKNVLHTGNVIALQNVGLLKLERNPLITVTKSSLICASYCLGDSSDVTILSFSPFDKDSITTKCNSLVKTENKEVDMFDISSSGDEFISAIDI